MNRTNIGGLSFNLNKDDFSSFDTGITREWVMTNGLGSYAASSVIDSPMRKHHGLLIASLWSPVKRYLILSKLNESLTIGDKTYPLHTSKYKTKTTEGFRHLENFYYDTFPIYTYKVDTSLITKELLIKYGKNSTIIKYTISSGDCPLTLDFKPCFNFKAHGDSSTKETLNFEYTSEEQKLCLLPKDEDYKISYRISKGNFKESKDLYDEDNYLDFEFNTGMDELDSHYTPVTHALNVAANSTVEFFVQCEVAQLNKTLDCKDNTVLSDYYKASKEEHLQRMKQLIQTAEVKSDFAKRLVLSSDQFIANRNSTKLKTVLAGLPWFSDWGRDTMIAIGGLTIATKQFETAKEIISSFAKYIHNGLLPNMFPDEGLEPLYNSVDASLWYFQAVYQYYMATDDKSFIKELYPILKDIVNAFMTGTDFSIYMDDDMLIHAGSGLDQITWMDVRINGIVVTPRHGKPVEINALWYNALNIMDLFARELNLRKSYEEIIPKVKESFNQKFWNEDTKCLNDVVDEVDPSIRPNQIYAVSLPFTMLDGNKNKLIVETVYEKLYTPTGLRSLDMNHKDYKGIYSGQLIDRDFAYHQGTSWGFLLGGFIDAYRKTHPERSKEEVINTFLLPMKEHLYTGCLGGISEIFDGDPPHHHRGCYTQAWSVSETLRVLKELEA